MLQTVMTSLQSDWLTAPMWLQHLCDLVKGRLINVLYIYIYISSAHLRPKISANRT